MEKFRHRCMDQAAGSLGFLRREEYPSADIFFRHEIFIDYGLNILNPLSSWNKKNKKQNRYKKEGNTLHSTFMVLRNCQKNYEEAIKAIEKLRRDRGLKPKQLTEETVKHYETDIINQLFRDQDEQTLETIKPCFKSWEDNFKKRQNNQSMETPNV